MAERKTITKKLRFEVFKRDSFTCQYCGKMAPDVILEIDHINPVIKGGANDILNLVTSCFDCNRGKGKRSLDEKHELKKQQEEIKKLGEKKAQLKMLIDWRKELFELEQEKINIIITEINNIFGININLTDTGIKSIKKLINSFELELIFESIKISYETYYLQNDLEFCFNKISGICFNLKKQKEDPLYSLRKKAFYRTRNHFKSINENDLKQLVNKLINNEKNGKEQLDLYCEVLYGCDYWFEFKGYWRGCK